MTTKNTDIMERLPKIALPAIIGFIFLIILISKSAVTIDAGEAGVLFQRFGDGVVTDKTYQEGFHLVAPWNSMTVYKVRQQSISDRMKVLSVNGLEVGVNGTVWFHPDNKNLGMLHKTKGLDYIEAILAPAINAAARSVVGRYTPEQLYSSKRDVIQNEVLEEVQKSLADQYITINRVLIEDVTLPPTIKTAIETKLKQEQESLEYEFRLEKSEKEAQRQRIEAQGKSDANRILSKSLNDKILRDKGIEATNRLSESPNSKVIIIGSGDSGLPIILGGQ